jgi:hypothetical protein
MLPQRGQLLYRLREAQAGHFFSEAVGFTTVPAPQAKHSDAMPPATSNSLATNSLLIAWDTHASNGIRADAALFADAQHNA